MKRLLRIGLLFLFSASLFASPILFADETYPPEHAKLVTLDATPTDPGHVEEDLTYTIRGGKFAWQPDMGRYHRGTFLTQQFDSETYVGLHKDIDVIITQGFQHLLDKENSSRESRQDIDPLTGQAVEGTTEGPTHGFGRSDLGITPRWRFYNSQEKKIELTYASAIFVPTGRRSNLDHLGPGAGYVNFGNNLIYTQEYKRFCWTLNTGYNAPLANSAKTGNYRGTWNFNAAAGYQILSWLHPQVEAIYNHDFESRGKGGKLVSVVAGAIVTVNEHLRFDLGIEQDVLGSNKDQLTSGIFRVAFTT